MKYIKIIIATLGLALIGTLFIQHNRITHFKEEKVKYEHNVNVLMSDIETYQTRDSLNVARIESLELSVGELERFRKEDLRIIENLKMKNRDLSALTKSYLATITHLKDHTPRDTLIIRDSVEIPAKTINICTEWVDLKGIYTDSVFEGTITSRDSLLIVESVQFKKFLWWKTKKIKNRYFDVTSMNPHTKITGFEVITVEK